MAPFSSYETPVITRKTLFNPYECEPSTPEPAFRLSFGTRDRVLSNIENISAPSFRASPPQFGHRSPHSSQNPLFKAALQNMRQGNSLQILRAERDAQVKAEEATTRVAALSGSSQEKRPSNPKVALERQASQKRNSGLARSA
jgi:hypothetical protein